MADVRLKRCAGEEMRRNNLPKWPNVRAVDVSEIPVRKRRKAQGGSSRIIAGRPTAAVHHYSISVEDGEAQHWIRQFFFGETGAEYVHGPSYHTTNAKGKVQYGQSASMLPGAEHGELFGKAIEAGIIKLPQRTLEFLRGHGVNA